MIASAKQLRDFAQQQVKQKGLKTEIVEANQSCQVVTEFGLDQILAAIDTIRHVDHRGAYASSLHKKLTAKKALQINELAIIQATKFELDASTVEKGNCLRADIARKVAARKSE